MLGQADNIKLHCQDSSESLGDRLCFALVLEGRVNQVPACCRTTIVDHNPVHVAAFCNFSLERPVSMFGRFGSSSSAPLTRILCAKFSLKRTCASGFGSFLLLHRSGQKETRLLVTTCGFVGFVLLQHLSRPLSSSATRYVEIPEERCMRVLLVLALGSVCHHHKVGCAQQCVCQPRS